MKRALSRVHDSQSNRCAAPTAQLVGQSLIEPIEHLQQAIIERADGFMELGLSVGAWETLEDLPQDAKNQPKVLALRIHILAHEREWLKVSLLAEGVLSAFPTLSGVWYDLAKAKTQLGDLDTARVALKRAFELDAGLRLEALDDLELEAVW